MTTAGENDLVSSELEEMQQNGAEKEVKKTKQQEQRQIMKQENKAFKDKKKKEKEEKKKKLRMEALEQYRAQYKQEKIDKIKQISDKRNKAILKQLRPVSKSFKTIVDNETRIRNALRNEDINKFISYNLDDFKIDSGVSKDEIERIMKQLEERDAE